MKRIFKFISFSFVNLFLIISMFGCSCSRKMNIYYELKIENENEVVSSLEIETTITKKFREAVDTPCYKKVGDKYELIKDASEIYKCYDKDGNYFEKATYDRVDKLELKKEFPVTSTNNVKHYESDKITIPDNADYSLIYKFIIKNTNKEVTYIEKFGIEEILNNVLKDESVSKVTVKTPTDTVVINEKECFLINKNSSISITVELKDLKVKDSLDKRTRDLKLYIPINVVA